MRCSTGLRLARGSPCASRSFSQSLPSRIGSNQVRKDEQLRSAARLSWANGESLGVTMPRDFLRSSIVNSTATLGREGGWSLCGTFRVSAFTREQSKMVKESWKLLQKNNPGEHALKLFLKVFEIAPSVKKMFSFLREDVPLEQNPHLKVHALAVLSMTGQAAAQLGETGALNKLMPKLMELGKSHVAYGVVDEHFDVVKYALLATLAEALPNEWNADLTEAWSVAYEEIVKEIKNQMRTDRAAPKQLASV